MDKFKEYHPFVIVLYALFIMFFSVVCIHPVYVIINFVSSVICMCLTKKSNPWFLLVIIMILSIEYPLNNHRGITIITYLPDGNPFTLESVIYGLVRCMRICSFICWYLFFSYVLTTDKLMCVLGRVHPSLSLLLSVMVRFVPLFIEKLKDVIRARQSIGHDVHNSNIFKRLKVIVSIFSVMITWSIENSINISDSMKARGYGAGQRTAFFPCKFHTRDIYLLIAIIIIGMYNTVFFYTESIGCRYFPSICCTEMNYWFFTGYFTLCMFPVTVDFLLPGK